MGKSLDRYMKKNGKVDPFKGDKGGKTSKGADAAKMPSQYAKKSGKKITDDAKAYDETDPASGTAGAYEAIKSNGKAAKKQRNYLNC